MGALPTFNLRHSAAATGALILLVFCSSGFSQPLEVAKLERTKPVEFSTEIFPLLKANCLACHNSTKAKADLILETPDEMLRGGDSGPAIEPGHADHSLLFTTAAHLEEPVMPPPNNKSNARNFTPMELALLRQWINEGAKGERVTNAAPESWSFLDDYLPINVAAITGDGRFAALGRGQKVEIHDLRLGRIVARLLDPSLSHPAAHRDLVQSLAFSPDGALASGGFRTVKIWERKAAQPTGETIALESEITSSTSSPPGDGFALGLQNGSVALFDPANPDRPGLIRDHASSVRGLAFSREGNWIYTISDDQTLRGRSLVDIDQTKRFNFQSPPTAITFLRDDRLLVATGDHQLHLFDVGDLSRPTHSFKLLDHPVIEMGSIREELFVAYRDGNVVICQSDTSNPEKPLAEVRRFVHGGGIAHIAASETHIATAAESGPVKLWSIGDGKLIGELSGNPQSPATLERIRREIAVQTRLKSHWNRKAPESEKLWKSESEKARQSGSAIARARLEVRTLEAVLRKLESNPEANKETLEKTAPSLKEASLRLTSAIRNRDDSSRLAGESFRQHAVEMAAALEAETAIEELKKQEGETSGKIAEEGKAFAARDLEFSPDGTTLLVASKGQGVQTYRSSDASWVESIDAEAHGILVTSGRVYLAIDGLKQWVPWSTGGTWTLARTLGNGRDPEPFSDRVSALSFSPDGTRLLTGGGIPSRNGEISLWDTREWKVLASRPEAHRDTVTSFAFSPDGGQFASGATDRLVRTFDTETLDLEATLEGHSSHVLDVDWNDDGLTLASAGADLQVKVWDISNLKEKSKLAGFAKEVSAVLFLAGSENLVTASGDRSLKLSNQPLPGSGATFFHAAAASEDGRVIIAGGQDGVLRVWDGIAKKLIREIPAPESDQLAMEP